MTQIRAAMIAMNKELGDGWTATMTLQEGMQAMSDKAGGSATALKELTGRVEGTLGILALTGKNAKGAAEDLEAMTNSAGNANKAFDTMKNLNPLDKFKQTLDNFVLSLGDAVLGSSAFSGAMDDMSRAAKEAENGTSGLVAVMEGLITAGRFVANRIGDVAITVKDLSAGLRSLFSRDMTFDQAVGNTTMEDIEADAANRLAKRLRKERELRAAAAEKRITDAAALSADLLAEEEAASAERIAVWQKEADEIQALAQKMLDDNIKAQAENAKEIIDAQKAVDDKLEADRKRRIKERMADEKNKHRELLRIAKQSVQDMLDAQAAGEDKAKAANKETEKAARLQDKANKRGLTLGRKDQAFLDAFNARKQAGKDAGIAAQNIADDLNNLAQIAKDNAPDLTKLEKALTDANTQRDTLIKQNKTLLTMA